MGEDVVTWIRGTNTASAGGRVAPHRDGEDAGAARDLVKLGCCAWTNRGVGAFGCDGNREELTARGGACFHRLKSARSGAVSLLFPVCSDTGTISKTNVGDRTFTGSLPTSAALHGQ